MKSFIYIFKLVKLFLLFSKHDAFEAFLPIARGNPDLEMKIRHLRLFAKKKQTKRPGQRLAEALEALGPPYIKFGQLLSTRADLMGEQGALDLSVLQDQLAPFDASVVVETISEAFDKPLEQLFPEFDMKPVSAASIAQVHFAKTHEGDDVAVKILRPNIKAIFERELDFLSWLTKIAEVFSPVLRRVRLPAVIGLYRAQLSIELDLRLEASQADEFKANFKDRSDFFVPAIFWPLTAQSVMTIERLDATSIDDKEGLLAQGSDLEDVLTRAAETFFMQIFEHGFFHGDQHAGNMFVTKDGSIAFVDFGIMGRMDWQSRCFLADIMAGLVRRDYSAIAKTYAEAGFLPTSHHNETFAMALRSVCEPIIDKPLKEVSFAKLLGQLLEMGRTFDLTVQPELYVLQKNMVMAEGIARTLAPEMNIWTFAQPLVEDWVVRNRNPLVQVKETLSVYAAAAGKMPKIIDSAEKTLAEMEKQRAKTRSWWIPLLIAAGFGAGILLTSLTLS